MDFQTLYDFTYSLTKLYDEANDRTMLVEGFKKALSLFFPIEELKIYMMDEFSFLLKDFAKPWENLSLNNENDEIKKYFDTECEYYMPFIGFELDGEPFCKKKHFLLNKGDCKKCKVKNNVHM